MIPIGDAEIFVQGIEGSEGVVQATNGTIHVGSTDGWIYSISRDGVKAPFVYTGGRPLGIAISRGGELIVCNGKTGVLQSVDRAGRVSVLAEYAGDRHLQEPNFAVFDDDGWLYFSDSGSADRANPKADGAVFLRSPDGQVQIFADRLCFPNGLAMRRGESALYVIQTAQNNIVRLEILQGRRLGNASIYADSLHTIPDGMAFAENGDLLITCVGTNMIRKISFSQTSSILIEDPAGECICGPANCAFIGQQLDEMLITNLKAAHVTHVRIGQRGQPLYHQFESTSSAGA